MAHLDSAPMFYIKSVLNPNALREAVIAHQSGAVFDILVTIVGGTSAMQLRGRTLFPGKEEELKALRLYPDALGESEVRFHQGIIDPQTKVWRKAMIVLDTERRTGTVTLWVE